MDAAAALPNARVPVPIIARCVNVFRMLRPGERLVRLQNYPQIAVEYAPRRDPNFATRVARLVDQIATAPTGQVLLADIARATPTARGAPLPDPEDPDAADRPVFHAPFPPGVNVIIRPPRARNWRTLANVGSPPRTVRVAGAGGANQHVALDQTEASPEQVVRVEDDGAHVRGGGGGSVAVVQFNEQVAWTSQGEHVEPHVALAHELIHAHHSLYGEKLDGRDEEHATTGLYDRFRDGPMTENRIRNELGLPRRTRFYPDDAPDIVPEAVPEARSSSSSHGPERSAPT